MCGIAGILSPDPSLVTQEKLQRMTDSLQHRGPDGEGYWKNEEGTLLFGHRRLAIIDTSEAASQPFHYLDYTLIFNGEIYNYIELKELLRKKGYSFTTSSDIEIIPAAYDCWGKDCLHHFDGMFAFALYNAKEKELLIARDRFGEKPLYYHTGKKVIGNFSQLIFASEMKALWAASLEKQMNGSMLLNYLSPGYLQNPINKAETFYSNILSLPPGYRLLIQPSQGKIKKERWYTMNRHAGSDKLTESSAIEKFRELLFESVKRRLRSDVPLGASLSGGLDSSSIAAVIQKLTDHSPLNCFTAIFPGYKNDEASFSKEVADHLHIQQYTVTPTADDWINNWKQLMHHQEEPLQSSSVLTQFMVYKLAKEKGVTVLLDGQGADEILGGYKKYTHWYLQSLLRTHFSSFQKEKKLLQQNDFLDRWGLRNYAAAFFPAWAAKQLQMRAINQQNKSPDINKEFLHNFQNTDILQKPVIQQLEDILYYNTVDLGLEELLRYADRNSMAHSREVRLPFLQHELVEFIFSLPSSFKIKEGFTKWILRKSMQSDLPGSIVWRKNKIGYEPPQEQWMQNKRIQEMIMEGKKKLVTQGILNPIAINSPVIPQPAHSAENSDWRYLCAAELF